MKKKILLFFTLIASFNLFANQTEKKSKKIDLTCPEKAIAAPGWLLLYLQQIFPPSFSSVTAVISFSRRIACWLPCWLI